MIIKYIKYNSSTLLFFVMIVFTSLAVNAEENTDYQMILEDIPKMEKMYADKPVIFETPEGRIAEIITSVKANPKEIKQFYKDSLTNLGWKIKKENTYQRGKEILILTIKESDNLGTTVTFLLQPIDQE